MCDNKIIKNNIKKINKELKNIKVNNFEHLKHIIINKEDFCGKDLKMAYDDLKCFDFADCVDFLLYEELLEDCDCGDKKR